MPRHARHDHEPFPPACCSCCYGCDGGCAPAPCYHHPAPVPQAPCYYTAPVPASCYYPAPVLAPPSSSASDPLLQALAARLLLGSFDPAPAPATPPQSQQPPPPPAAPAVHHAANPYPYPHHYEHQHQEAKPHVYAHPPPAQQRQHPHQPQPNASDHGHLLLHSLLRRVAALESALPRRFPHRAPVRRAPHPNPGPRRVARQELVEDEDDEEEDSEPSPPSPPPHRRPPRRSSARELAARTIQAHFRRFLARRSRTLRQLKELAVLRSKAAALRGSLSGRRGGADPAAVSEAATGLLLQLDAIQGGDPMIREGRRAVSRELTRILEFVDKVLVKEQESMGNALDRDGYHESCGAEFVSNRPAVNKKVSFSNNGRIHELNGETGNVKEVDEGSESSGSSESDGAKGMPTKRSANGKPGLATPVHMELRRVAGERR